MTQLYEKHAQKIAASFVRMIFAYYAMCASFSMKIQAADLYAMIWKGILSNHFGT